MSRSDSASQSAPESGSYMELSVPVDGEAAEAVCELFERYGGGAVVEVLVAGPEDGTDLADPRVNVRTYVPAGDVGARAKLEEGLWHLGRLYPIPRATVRRLARANWEEAWKSHYEPQRIGRHFLVVPSWIDPEPEPDDKLILIDPGMAFGTGLHPTTRLCLAELERLLKPGERVLDVGTGSGILAIGAARLGASYTCALDCNPEAVDIAAANARRNAVAIEVFAGELTDLPAGAYDVVVANLLAATIVELSEEFSDRLLPGGRLITSGILADQAEEVASSLAEAGLDLEHIGASGDWTTVVCARASIVE